ncbi:plasmid stabilization system protein ParE [Mucilaginibacter dorajii]|nr:plasmid stabilization system protein ParE [Mucilaginibacter dorajii]
MTIIWSEKAGETFQKNVEYLLANWSENESKKFIERVFQYLDTRRLLPAKLSKQKILI